MSAPVEPAENAKPRRLWSRLRLAVVVLLGVASLLAIDAYRRHRRVEWLVSEIESAGVGLVMPKPILEQLWDGDWRELDREVELSIDEHTDGAWLREHDYLRGLEIIVLEIIEVPEPRPDFAKLVEWHPIKEVWVYDVQGADDIAMALNECASLRIVDFEGSDLTDKGFCGLPLEQLTEISIANTSVTSEGARAFNRCHALTCLSVDGKQLETAVSELVHARATLDELWLTGPDVEDRQLESLIRLRPNYVHFHRTSATADAVKNLRSRMPDCDIFN